MAARCTGLGASRQRGAARPHPQGVGASWASEYHPPDRPGGDVVAYLVTLAPGMRRTWGRALTGSISGTGLTRRGGGKRINETPPG